MEPYMLSPEEIGELYEGLCHIVERNLRNTDNPNARVQPYGRAVHGPTHFSIGLEGVNRMDVSFCIALKELSPGATCEAESLPDGRPKGWQVELPIKVMRKVRKSKHHQHKARHGKPYTYPYRGQPATLEWALLLLMLAVLVGGILIYRFKTGQLY